MDELINLAQDLKKELEQLPLFIEYKKVKEAVDNSIEIKELKKQIIRAKNEGRLDEHKKLLSQYDSHPLIVNLRALEEDTKDYLTEIVEILNKK